MYYNGTGLRAQVYIILGQLGSVMQRRSNGVKLSDIDTQEIYEVNAKLETLMKNVFGVSLETHGGYLLCYDPESLSDIKEAVNLGESDQERSRLLDVFARNHQLDALLPDVAGIVDLLAELLNSTIEHIGLNFETQITTIEYLTLSLMDVHCGLTWLVDVLEGNQGDCDVK